MTSADVKSWFDWIEKNFKGSIKAHGALANYWRTLKRLYFLKTRREMDADMRVDCLNVRDGLQVPIQEFYLMVSPSI
jgi:hypothetical protein